MFRNGSGGNQTFPHSASPIAFNLAGDIQGSEGTMSVLGDEAKASEYAEVITNKIPLCFENFQTAPVQSLEKNLPKFNACSPSAQTTEHNLCFFVDHYLGCNLQSFMSRLFQNSLLRFMKREKDRNLFMSLKNAN